MLWEFDLTVSHIGATPSNGWGLLWGYLTRIPQIKVQGGAKLALGLWRARWQQRLGDLPWTSPSPLGMRGLAAAVLQPRSGLWVCRLFHTCLINLPSSQRSIPPHPGTVRPAAASSLMKTDHQPHLCCSIPEVPSRSCLWPAETATKYSESYTATEAVAI